MQYIESYSIEKTNFNGVKNVTELASKYNGNELKIFKNINGNVTYKSLNNAELLDYLHDLKPNKKSLTSRLRSYKKRSISKPKTHKTIKRVKRRRLLRQKNSSSKPISRSRTHRRKVTPDIMKTIY